MARKPFEQLNFADDGMFQAVMKNPEVSAELVERLLGVRVKDVKYPKLEKKIAPYYTTKGVRLDVYLKDVDKIIDVELQTYEMDALGKRSRYYQSMVDIDSLMKGEDYSELKDSYILFICKFDPFKDKNGRPHGLYRYTFRNICAENSSVNLDDKCLKVVYNTAIAPFWQGNYPLALSRALSMQARTDRQRTQKFAPCCALSRPMSPARIHSQNNWKTLWSKPGKLKNTRGNT